jgi:putative salt-induced outer membrane protein
MTKTPKSNKTPRAACLARLPFVLSIATSISLGETRALAEPAPEPVGAPPPDAKALVETPTAPAEAPAIDKSADGTTVTASAGGQLMTGNSQMLAGTANGVLESRFGNNGFGAAILANYGEGATPGNTPVATTENAQGRLRYDRYVAERASIFLIATGRHDRFQGLDFRLNLDPGVKYLFVKEQADALWAEAGYDFQYDIRRDDARTELQPNLPPVRLSKTGTDHSTRLFAGLRHAFNTEVTLATGLEYLQSVIGATRYRLNFDALFAAKVGGGLAIGVGFGARYDHDPLPAKLGLDTTSTLSLIYSHTDAPAAPTK